MNGPAAATPRVKELRWDDTGSGDAVLFLHGFPLDRTMWAPQVAALSARARCIVPDLRGLGASPAPAGGAPWRIDDYAHDAAALLDALEVERAHVVGLSMGGYVALALWRLYPDRVSGMALLDTRAGADSEEGRAKRDEMMQLARSGGAAAVAEKQIAGLVGKTTREERPAVLHAALEMMRRAPVDGILAALCAMRDRPDSTTLLDTITVPALVVVGEEDVLTPPKDARLLAERIPGARLEVVARAGHLSSLEQPQVVNELLRRWIAG